MNEQVINLSIDDIIPNRFQPREVFKDQALDELALSIKEHGVIQPIIVRPIVNNKYEIIAGERRYKASTIAGKTTIPAIVRNLDDKETSKQALLENIQRQDLTPIEEARTYQTILSLDNITQEELAKTMGKSQSAISNKLRLLTLPEEVQEALLNSEISERHARSLLTVQDVEKQKSLLNEIITKKIPVRILDEMIKKENEGNNMNNEINNSNFVNKEINQNFLYDGNINENLEVKNQELVNNQPFNLASNEVVENQNLTYNQEMPFNISMPSNNTETNNNQVLENTIVEEPVSNNLEENSSSELNFDRFKKVDFNNEIKQTITGEEILGEGLLAGKPVEEVKENVIAKIEPIKVPAYILNNNSNNELVMNEELKNKSDNNLEEKVINNNETILNNISNDDVLISQTGGMILPTNQEIGVENNASIEPNENTKNLINSQDLKLALIGIGNVINNLKARGIEVKEIRKTYQDHLELTLEIKKN